MKLKLSIIFFLCFGLTVISCEKNKNNCPGPEFAYYKILEFKSTAVDPYGRTVDENEFHYLDSIQLKIAESKTKYAECKPVVKWDLASTAYACEPTIPKSTNYLESIFIIAEDSSSSNGKLIYPGDTLNGYFTTYGVANSQLGSDNVNTALKLRNKDYPYPSIYLKLLANGLSANTYRFSIHTKLSDGIEYIITDQILKIY